MMMEKSPNMQLWDLSYYSLPEDIALKIASFLSVCDVCSLGCCSRFWRELCSSDFIWFSLCKCRWPSYIYSTEQLHNDIVISSDSSLFEDPTEVLSSSLPTSPTDKAWRSFYIKRHQVMADHAMAIVKFVKQCSKYESLEVGDYLRAIGDVCSTEFGFKDVQLFLFSKKQSVLLNMIGLHYSLFWLRIPAKDIVEALSNCHISERQVCVRWWKLGRWFHGFRLQDESRSRRVSLGDLVLAEEVMGVLQRGAIHEVLRVQISGEPATTSWVYMH